MLRAAGCRIDREPGSGDEVVTGWRVETTIVLPDDGRVRTALLTALRTVGGARVRAVETLQVEGTIQIRADLTGTADAGPALDAVLSGVARDPTVTGTSCRHLADEP
ncbi:hypothetical protein PT931_29345 [Longispora urticae]